MENYVDNNGVKLWTDVRGNNENGYILLCNGGPGSCDYLLDVSKMIEDEYCVIRFEQRGCGRSDADGHYELNTVLDDLEAIRSFYGIEKWIVGGHSWGANLALIYALKYAQNVISVLYLAGNGFQRNREWSATYHMNREEFGEEMPKMQYEGNPEVNKQGNMDYQNYIQRPTLFRDIANLDVKILFMCAQNDVRPNWPTEQLYYLAKHGTIVFIENATHYLWLHQNQEVKHQLRSFLGLSID
jgi:proline iminopeptidase